MYTKSKFIDEQLEELKLTFDMRKMPIDGSGQEFLYAVTKRFTAVFNAQSEANKMLPFPYVKTAKVCQVIPY